MNISSFEKSTNEISIKGGDNASASNDEDNDYVIKEEDEFMPLDNVVENDGEEDEEEDSDDNENYEQDLLLDLGEGYSEEQSDLPGTSHQLDTSSTKLPKPVLKTTQDSGSGLTGHLDLLNLKQLSKLVVPGTSNSGNTNESTCLFLNNIYQALLMENLTKLRQRLAENQEKQKVLLEKIKISYKTDTNKPRKNVFCIPYFHIKGNTPQPNEHTKVLQTWHYDKIAREKPWTNKEHELLLEGVHENAWEMKLKPYLQRLEIYSVKLESVEEEVEKTELEQKIEDTKLELEIAQQQDIDEILKKTDESKFDWMKISNISLKGKHSEFSCFLMWKNWLHPRLNKSPWTQAETKKLEELVELHGRHQWKLIAEELGTNRTPFHCLQHYRRKLDFQVKRKWTEEEDKILKEVIDTCQIGNHIPWNQVSFYMEGRSAENCSKRWSSLNPEIKHGRWTNEEDSLLLAAVNMLGTFNWRQIKQLIPRRTTAQCRERWINCLDPGIKTEAFTYDEDKLLLKFVQEHGYNWARVSTMLPGRTDGVCRRQYEKLKKWGLQAKYVEEQTAESKSFFLHNFDVKHFADLVERNKTLDELLPLTPGENDQLDIIWKNQQQMLKRDLVRQEIDQRKGEIFVPRPQLLRKYTSPALIKLWEHRKKLQQTIQDFIQKQMVKNIKSPKKGTSKYTMISTKLGHLKPNTSVNDMLDIARSFSNKSELKRPVESKKRLSSDVDKKIKNLLYLHWLKEDLKDQPKLSLNKSKAICEEEKYMDRLEGMTLIMTALGMDRPNVLKHVLGGTSSGTMQSTHYMSAEELQNFKEEFMLISKNPQCSGNFSGNEKPMVEFSDVIPPNIHTLTAFRLLILERQRLQKSADNYLFSLKKSDEGFSNFLTLPQKMKIVKHTFWYQMLRNHFRSLFLWPALLSTMSGVSCKLAVSESSPENKNRKSNSPLFTMTRKKRKIHHRKNTSPNKKKKQIPKPNEESNNNSETAVTADSSADMEQSPQKRGKGRPVGSVTKNKKVYDPLPQRTSSRQREKKARLDSELFVCQPIQNKRRKQTLDKQTPSTSTNNQNPEMTIELSCETSAQSKDLLANVSPDLVQQVISQEVEVKPIGTYITLPIVQKTNDMPSVE